MLHCWHTMNSRSTVAVWHGDTIRVSRCFWLCTSQLCPALDLLGGCVCVCVRVCACMSAPPTKFSLFTNTHLFIGQIRKSVCTCVSVCICYLPACKSGLRSVHSELDRSIDRFVNNEILDGKWVFFFFLSKWIAACRNFCWWIRPNPGVSSYHSPPVSPVSRDVSLFCIEFYCIHYKL